MHSRESLRVIETHLLESARLKQRVATELSADIASAAEVIVTVFRSGGKLLLCGNGGSAADCQHIAAEFVSVLERQALRPPLPAIALTTDTSFLTASANDFGFEQVFARQVEALGRAGDVLMGISTSGGSPNVVAALVRARELGVRTIVLTGQAGGRAAELGDVVIRIPSRSTQLIQEAHIAIGHVVCGIVEGALFPSLRASFSG